MLYLLASTGLIHLTYYVATLNNLGCEETADHEVTDKLNVKSVLYIGMHLGCGILIRGMLLPHVFS